MKSIIFINKKLLIVLALFFCISKIGWSQNYSEDEDNTTEATTEVNGTNVSPEFFSSFFDTAPNSKLATVQGKSIFIRQIGESNTVAANVKSNASDINVTQNGSFNAVELSYNVNKVVTDLAQNGNSNEIKDYVIDTSADISLDLIQNGDGLKFERFGNNEISKNIKFTQTAASPSIIIRSFD